MIITTLYWVSVKQILYAQVFANIGFVLPRAIAIAHRFKCPIFILAIDTPSLTLKRIINPGYPVTNLIFQQPIADIGVSNALWDVMANMYEKFIVNFYYANHQVNSTLLKAWNKAINTL